MERADLKQDLALELEAPDLELARAVAALVACNPFVPERVEIERQILGADFREFGTVWHIDKAAERNPNLELLNERLEPLVERWRQVVVGEREGVGGSGVDPEVRRLYPDVVVYHLYNRYEADLRQLIESVVQGERKATAPVSWWRRFQRDVARFFPDGTCWGVTGDEVTMDAALLVAWFFQLRRAFHFIFVSIYGGSLPAAELRAEVWRSVFSHDMRRFRRGLYTRMGDITTLITGPSGTGKELVARAIGLSRFIPFDADRGAFTESFEDSFFALNLSALSPTLVESELFGHRRGAFTGAVEDRPGWFEVCPPLGTIFLDEIGEISEAIQVKLLRVLQTRTFQRLGDTEDRRFGGKVVAATNREPEVELREGRMREDFYYRICSDMVRTPSLREQLDDAPEELRALIDVVARQLVGPEEAPALSDEVEAWVTEHLGSGYPWSGNFRELEQCVRNIVIRGRYLPAGHLSAGSPVEADFRSPEQRFLDGLATDLAAARLDAETLLTRYATWVYVRTGSYQGAARRLGLDRRTVKARVDEDLLAGLRQT